MLNENIIFYSFSIFLVFSAFMVVVSQHPVFSLLFLVSSFIFSSFILFLLECELLALLFIIVYVGAIAVLFLFAIMMLESKLSDLSKNVMKYTPIGFIFGIILLFPQLRAISNNFDKNIYYNSFYQNKFQNWYDLIDSTTDIEVYGQVLYSYFVLQLLIVGLILLLVLIGVVYLTNNYNVSRQTLDQAAFKQLAREAKIFLSNN
jgi:NADH-quinone oxidoreductase subunit J